MLQDVLIRRANGVYAPQKVALEQDVHEIAEYLVGASKLGFTFDADALRAMVAYNDFDLSGVGEAMLLVAGTSLSDPLHVNFPKSVREMSDFEIRLKAIVHYIGTYVFGADIRYEEEKVDRPEFNDTVNLKKLTVLSGEDVRHLVFNLLRQPESYSQSDVADLKVLLESEFGDVIAEIENETTSSRVSNRENLIHLIRLAESTGASKHLSSDDALDGLLKTSVDVLRLASALSGGDLTLAENTRFKLSRPNRRRVLSNLERVLSDNPSTLGDMARYEERWKRLAKTVHIREHWPCYFNAISALNDAQAGLLSSFDGRVDKAVRSGNATEAIDLLKTKPGVFARNLERVLRAFPSHSDEVLTEFEQVAESVSTRVLISLWNLHRGPTSDVVDRRVIGTYSSNSKSVSIPNRFDASHSGRIVDALTKALEGRHSETKVFIPSDFDDGFALPLSVRSTSSNSRIVGRGSRIPFDSKVLRLFMHWKNAVENGRSRATDLDLSALFVRDLDMVGYDYGEVAYYRTRLLDRKHSFIAMHSGDITNAPKGAAEYIDIDLQAAEDEGYRYIVPNVLSYSKTEFEDIPEAWAGFMGRNNPESGEVFEPRTVGTRYDLHSGTTSVPFMVDVVNREIVWVDRPIPGRNFGRLENQSARSAGLDEMLKSIAYADPVSARELIELVATLVDEEDEADVSVDEERVDQIFRFME